MGLAGDAVPDESDHRFQILCLDGGGYKGMFSAAVLAQLEEDLGITVADQFDLIAGTSTGGIIALGLGIGMRPREIVDFYLKHGPRIFGHVKRRAPLRLFRPKFSARPLYQAVEEVFGDRLFCESRVPLVIPSFDLRSNKVHLFRTPHLEKLRRDWKERIVDVAMATSAAPTYFPAHNLRGLRLIDGGVIANNPAVVALSEAVGELGVPLDGVRMLSLGTTAEVAEPPARLDRGGLLAWAGPAASLIMQCQSMAVRNGALHLLPDGHLLRINPQVPEGLLRLDGVTPEELAGRAEQESRHISEEYHRMFGGHRPRPYTPHYAPGREPAPDAPHR